MSRDVWLRMIILILGGALFVLLLFADKTNLTNKPSAEIEATGVAQPSSTTSSQLPPLAPDPQLDQWMKELEGAKDEEKGVLLDSIVQTLTVRRRLAYAADYATLRADLDPTLAHQLAAGVLSQQATELTYVQADSVMSRRYQVQAQRFLESVVQVEPENEEALLALGLIRIRSAAPMQGILTIRNVLDINPDNLEASLRLGQFSLQTGQFDKAKQRFEKVLSLDPAQNEARYGLAVALSQLGEVAEAKALLGRVVEEASDIELKQAARKLLDQL